MRELWDQSRLKGRALEATLKVRGAQRGAMAVSLWLQRIGEKKGDATFFPTSLAF